MRMTKMSNINAQRMPDVKLAMAGVKNKKVHNVKRGGCCQVIYIQRNRCVFPIHLSTPCKSATEASRKTEMQIGNNTRSSKSTLHHNLLFGALAIHKAKGRQSKIIQRVGMLDKIKLPLSIVTKPRAPRYSTNECSQVCPQHKPQQCNDAAML